MAAPSIGCGWVDAQRARSEIKKAEPTRKASFLEGLAPREVEDVVAAATLRLFPATSVIMSQGQPANRLFLLTKGRGRYFFLTEGGRKLVVHWIMPGEIFGVSALFANHAAYALGAEMVEDGAVLVWD